MKLIIFSSLMLLTLTITHAVENQMASAQATNTTCTQEADTAKCGKDKVGTGLLSCLNDYKKSNKDFKISEVCEASLKQFRRDVKAKRE